MQTNFNPHAPMGMLNNQFGLITDEQLLEQLRHMAAYGTHNPTSLMLLHELHARAARSFGKTFVPVKELHGEDFLYTSIFKDGVTTHYFVADKETKLKIDEIFNLTKVENPPEGDEDFMAERIEHLLRLGRVFKMISVDEQGNPIGAIKRCGFASLFVGKGFGEEPRHSSKVLPLGVIEVPTLTLLNSDPNFLVNTVITNACQIITDRNRLAELDSYLRTPAVMREYLTAVTDLMRENGIGLGHSLLTQIHLFPVDSDVPVKFLGGLDDNWTTGFIKRERHPHLFPSGQNYFNLNGNLGGFSGFGEPGRSTGPGNWY